MMVAIASGKGGTGKTTLAVNLARAHDGPIRLLDCDVEEPNAHLFLGGTVVDRRTVEIPVPEVDPSRCDGCGSCSRVCEFNAIIALGDKPLVFPELCHGCGACTLACPRHAIREVGRRVGEIETVDAGLVTLAQGRLDIGAATATPVIRALKKLAAPDELTLLDAPPGTSCPVVLTLRGADCVVLVTEPTPFGLHDLQLAVETVRAMSLPHGVVVNRMGIGDRRVHEFCAREGIPVLAEIPDDRRIAEAYSRGELLVDALPAYRDVMMELWTQVRGLGKAAVA